MAKKVKRKIKLQIVGGQANPAPPIGPILGGAGVNIGEFVKQFNDATSDQMGQKVTVVLDVYEDRSFDFVIKTPPTSSLILRYVGEKSGSGKPNTVKLKKKLTKTQIQEIAEIKMPDLNATTIESAMKIVEGQCRSMGVEIS